MGAVESDSWYLLCRFELMKALTLLLLVLLLLLFFDPITAGHELFSLSSLLSKG